MSAVEVAAAAPAAAAGRTLAPWPDANRVAHESIRDQTNMIGNSVAAIVVAKWEGQLDVEQARRVLNPQRPPPSPPTSARCPSPSPPDRHLPFHGGRGYPARRSGQEPRQDSNRDTPDRTLPGYTLTLRTRLDSTPGTLGRLTSAIGEAGRDVGALDEAPQAGSTAHPDHPDALTQRVATDEVLSCSGAPVARADHPSIAGVQDPGGSLGPAPRLNRGATIGLLGQRGRDRQAVADITQPGPSHRHVHGQDQGLIARRLRPLDQFLAGARSRHTYNWNHLRAAGAAAATSSMEVVPKVDNA